MQAFVHNAGRCPELIFGGGQAYLQIAAVDSSNQEVINRFVELTFSMPTASGTVAGENLVYSDVVVEIKDNKALRKYIKESKSGNSRAYLTINGDQELYAFPTIVPDYRVDVYLYFGVVLGGLAVIALTLYGIFSSRIKRETEQD